MNVRYRTQFFCRKILTADTLIVAHLSSSRTCFTFRVKTPCDTALVPANRPEQFKKAAASGADAVILDVDDAVPPDAKQEARRSFTCISAFRSILCSCASMGTDWHRDNLASVPSLPIDGILFPKAEMGSPSVRLAAALRRRLPRSLRQPVGSGTRSKLLRSPD